MIFKIGGNDYEVKITYRMRRKWLESCDPKKIEATTPAEFDDVILDIIMMSLSDHFETKENLMDALDNDEFKTISKYISELPIQEGMTDIEKKPGKARGIQNISSAANEAGRKTIS